MNKSPHAPFDAAIILCSGSNGLGAVRSLARAHVPTVIICLSNQEPALRSRYPHHKHVISSEKPFDEAMLEALASYAGRHGVIIPTSDKFVAFMLRHRQRLSEGFLICMPDTKITDMLLDKHAETQAIEQIGIPLPKTVRQLPDTPDALKAALGLPILIKPRLAELTKHLDGQKNLLLNSDHALDEFYQKYHSVFESLLAQEVIQGDDENLWVCNCTFGNEYNLLTAFTFRRLR
ncbi:MAG: hypothetical protein AAF512_21065, partial [Pseudomonadota bacterium]